MYTKLTIRDHIDRLTEVQQQATTLRQWEHLEQKIEHLEQEERKAGLAGSPPRRVRGRVPEPQW